MILFAFVQRLTVNTRVLDERIATFLQVANNLTEAMDLLNALGIKQKVNMLHRLKSKGLLDFDFDTDSIVFPSKAQHA